jgi:hypothetical protein
MSYRSIARILRVSSTTVMRWFPDSSMIDEAKEMAKFVPKYAPDDPSEGGQLVIDETKDLPIRHD